MGVCSLDKTSMKERVFGTDVNMGRGNGAGEGDTVAARSERLTEAGSEHSHAMPY